MDKTEHEAEMLLSSEEVDQEEEEVAECPQTETIIHQQELEPTNQPTWRGALGRFKRWWPVVELKALLKLALPTVLMLFFQQFVYSTAILFAGHVSSSSRELDAVSLAISVSNVTGFAVIMGLSSAADTLCPQNFGAKNYKRVGEVYQQGLLILGVALLPVIALWINSESLFLLLQQPPCVVRLSSQFLGVFTLMLPPLIILTMTQRYLQAQSVVWMFTAIALLFNILTALFCALFLYGLHLGVFSIAVAMVLSAYLSTGCLLLYIKVRGLHTLTWTKWSIKSLDNWWVFLKLGIPGFCMIAFEWWTFEISVLVSGSLGETDLGVNTILLQLLTLLFMFPLGTGTAVSVRVGNELGSGRPLIAKRASYIALLLQFVIVSVLTIVLGIGHNIIAKVFTADPDVISEASYTIFAAIGLMFFDQIQGTISGVFRGAGLQLMAACINFVVFYIVGLPTGISLAFLTDLGTLGMWIGLGIASFIQSLIFLGILFSLNWDKLAAKAQKNSAGHVPPLTEDSVSVADSEVDGVNLVSFKDSKDEEPLIIETSLAEPSSPLSESPNLPESESPSLSKSSSPVSSGSCLRGRSRLLLCRGAMVMVGVCLVVISGALTGLLKHDELDSVCAAGNNCCVPVTPPTTHWTLTSSVSCNVCSMYSHSAFIAPTPLPSPVYK